ATGDQPLDLWGARRPLPHYLAPGRTPGSDADPRRYPAYRRRDSSTGTQIALCSHRTERGATLPPGRHIWHAPRAFAAHALALSTGNDRTNAPGRAQSWGVVFSNGSALAR